MEPSLVSAPLRAAVPLYSMWHKHRTAPVQGWHFQVERDDTAINGQCESDVSIRLMGSVDVFEVETRVWGTASVMFKTAHVIPKMTCESDAIHLTVKFPVGPKENAPWVGITWVDATRKRVSENAARINVVTDDYQRWTWRTVRNLFRGPKTSPKGKWKSIANQRERRRFRIPRPDSDGLKIEPRSIAPRKIW